MPWKLDKTFWEHKVAHAYMSFSHLSPFQLVLFIFSCWEMSDMWGIGGKKVNLPNIFLHFSFALYFAKGICGLDFEEQIFAVNAGNELISDETVYQLFLLFVLSVCKYVPWSDLLVASFFVSMHILIFFSPNILSIFAKK